MNTLDNDGLKDLKTAHPDWIWNRSDTHVILGVPGSPEAFKTIVEPGNSFSPGFGSYGVSTWVTVDDVLYATEELELTALHWRYKDGFLPVLECTWNAGPLTVSSSLFTEGLPDTRDIKTHLSFAVTNSSADTVSASAHLVVRSFGPAGGPIDELEFADRDVLINGAVALTMDTQPDDAGAVAYTSLNSDIGQLLRHGQLPPSHHVKDASTWASGAANFDMTLSPGQTWRLSATSFVHAGHPHLAWLGRERGLPYTSPHQEDFERMWRELLPVRLDLPDERFAEAFQAQLAFLAMSTVGVEPRISPISYPLWWLRDGSYALTALEKGGYAEWTDRAIRSAITREPFGGFGAEGDGAAELIWLISEHYLMTGDIEFLRTAFPYLQRNAELISLMRTTPSPVFGRTEIRTPEMMLRPDADLMAGPAEGGLIVGRMDHHFPLFWINGWSWFGLTRAALCADVLGEDSSRYRREAAELLAAMTAEMEASFGENDRDFTGSIWPTQWADPEDPLVQREFHRFWQEVRCPGGVHAPEPEWTYFEAGQAHNYILLGERAKAWVSIEMFLSTHAAQGLYSYHEGIGDENSSLQWQRSRGWDRIPHVTPHGWTAAEVFLLLRDALARETQDGGLVIGSGVPEEWMSSDFAVENLPTHFGRVSIGYDAATRGLSVVTERKPKFIRSELPAEVLLAANVSGAAEAPETTS